MFLAQVLIGPQRINEWVLAGKSLVGQISNAKIQCCNITLFLNFLSEVEELSIYSR